MADTSTRKVIAEVGFVLGSYFTRSESTHLMPTLISSAQMQYTRTVIADPNNFVGKMVRWVIETFTFINPQIAAVIVSGIMYYLEALLLHYAAPSSTGMVYLPMKQMIGATVGASIADYAGSMMLENGGVGDRLRPSPAALARNLYV